MKTVWSKMLNAFELMNVKIMICNIIAVLNHAPCPVTVQVVVIAHWLCLKIAFVLDDQAKFLQMVFFIRNLL